MKITILIGIKRYEEINKLAIGLASAIPTFKQIKVVIISPSNPLNKNNDKNILKIIFSFFRNEIVIGYIDFNAFFINKFNTCKWCCDAIF